MSDTTSFDDDASNDLDEAEELATASMLGVVPVTASRGSEPVRDPKLPDLAGHDGPKRPGEAADYLSEIGWGGVPGVPDQVSDINAHPDARRLLLENNLIRLNPDGGATARAFVVGENGELDYAARPGIVCSSVIVDATLGTRQDKAREAFTQYEHEWQKQTIGEGSADAGVPLIFSLKSTYRHVRDQVDATSQKTIYHE